MEEIFAGYDYPPIFFSQIWWISKKFSTREFGFTIFGFFYVYSKHKVFQVFPISDLCNMFMSIITCLKGKTFAWEGISGEDKWMESISAKLAICTFKFRSYLF